jgi:hypothetical protein
MAIMVLRRSVLKELYGDTRSDVSDDSDNDSLDSDSDTPQLFNINNCNILP